MVLVVSMAAMAILTIVGSSNQQQQQ